MRLTLALRTGADQTAANAPDASCATVNGGAGLGARLPDSLAVRLVGREQVERRPDGVEHLGCHVGRQAVVNDIPLAAAPHRVGVAEHAQVMAGRRTAPLDDYREIAGGKLSRLKRADDLEASRIAQTHHDPLSLASGPGREHARSSLFDRAVINDLVGIHVFLPLSSPGYVLGSPRAASPGRLRRAVRQRETFPR